MNNTLSNNGIDFKSTKLAKEILRNRMNVNKRSLSSMWQTNNRSNNFTTRFMGYMYEDTTMTKEQQKEVVLERMKLKMENTEKKRQILKYETIKKKRILSLYKQKWDVKLKNTDMPVEKLENVLSVKANRKRQRRAVLRIQTSVRRFLAQKKFKVLVLKRHNAA
jgi:hypothetical protein